MTNEKTLYPAMGDEEFTELLEDLQAKETETRKAGRQEYARTGNIFANFNRLASMLNMPPEKVWLVYAFKHLEGVLSWINGHTSQRESVHGRILDLRVYLALLDAMITSYESGNLSDNPETLPPAPEPEWEDLPAGSYEPDYHEDGGFDLTAYIDSLEAALELRLAPGYKQLSLEEYMARLKGQHSIESVPGTVEQVSTVEQVESFLEELEQDGWKWEDLGERVGLSENDIAFKVKAAFDSIYNLIGITAEETRIALVEKGWYVPSWEDAQEIKLRQELDPADSEEDGREWESLEDGEDFSEDEQASLDILELVSELADYIESSEDEIIRALEIGKLLPDWYMEDV